MQRLVGLLNGKEYELTSGDIVIADGEGVIGPAGIMGGADTEAWSKRRTLSLNVPILICTRYVARYAPRNFSSFYDADPFQ